MSELRCQECGSTTQSELLEGFVSLILHDKTCSNHFDNAVQNYRRYNIRKRMEIIEEENPNSGNKMAQSAEMENIDLRGKVSKLKTHLENLKAIVVGALVTVDWTLKVGLAIALWFFPVIQDRFVQAVGIAIYVILLTVISKAIIKAKSYTIEI